MDLRVRSDLAEECCPDGETAGIRVSEAQAGGCRILRVQIKDEEAAARIGKSCGRYVTLHRKHLCDLNAEETEEACRALAVELREMAVRVTGKRLDGSFSLLVAGLGNSLLTPDALGPETVAHLHVTRRLAREEGVSCAGRLCEISAVTAGVVCRTGLQSAEAVRGAAMQVMPDLILAVDALAARSTEHLFATVQLSDAGICPGSGIGGSRTALTAETVGAPVLAMGIPTAVECATLVNDALQKAGLAPDGEAGADLVGRGFFVSPTDIDLLLPQAALLLTGAIEKAFSFSFSELSFAAP